MQIFDAMARKTGAELVNLARQVRRDPVELPEPPQAIPGSIFPVFPVHAPMPAGTSAPIGAVELCQAVDCPARVKG